MAILSLWVTLKVWAVFLKMVQLQGDDVSRLHTLDHCTRFCRKSDCFAQHQPGIAGWGWLQLGRAFLATWHQLFCTTLYVLDRFYCCLAVNRV